MDEILKYSVISSNGKQVDKQTSVAVRLVSKNWLKSASRTLKRLDYPLIHIEIGCEYAGPKLNFKQFDDKKGNILELFASVFGKPGRLSESFLPLVLQLEPECFTKENEHLRIFLEQFSETISALYVNYPFDDYTRSLKCNHLRFPCLRKLLFRIDKSMDTSDKGFKLLQEVLKNSTNLNNFVLLSFVRTPLDISTLNLPASVKRMNLGCKLTNQSLTFMTSNNLPNLRTLNLSAYQQSEADLMFKVLEHYCKQLTKLDLRISVDDPSFCVRFPLMEKLTCLKLSGYWADPRMKCTLPKLVPNLTCFVLEDIEENLFFDLVQGSRYENIRSFKLTLESTVDYSRKCLSPREPILKEILASFPKIQELSLKFSIDEVSGLKYLFRNFTHLKKLGLDFDIHKVDDTIDYKIVSGILGISFKLAEALVEEKGMKLKVPMDNPESIMNLKGNSIKIHMNINFLLSNLREKNNISFFDNFFM